MKRSFPILLVSLFLSLASHALPPTLPPIWGTLTTCAGSSTTLIDSGGTTFTWSSSNTAVAAISGSGVVTGVSGGTATITYASLGTFVTATYTVNPMSLPITGNTVICQYATRPLADASSGGVWSSSNTGVATVSATGEVGGLALGTATIFYILPSGFVTGCMSSTTVTVGAPVGKIIGDSTICVGSAITLTDSTSGGVWMISNPAIATVGISGHVTGLAPGTAVIRYAANPACGADTAILDLVVTPGASPAVSGSTSVLAGSTTGLTGSVTGGTWSSGNSLVATVNAATGVVTGVASGTATITYTVSACGGIDTVTKVIYVTTHVLTPGLGNASSSITIFPTLSRGNVIMKWLVNGTEQGSISVVDITGREVYKSAIDLSEGSGVHTLNLSTLTNGMYLVRITTSSLSYNNKIEIRH